ncbi:MAG TPA: hypothetical protein VIL46_08040, partial [Gemmataceae bacterium]
VLAGATYLGLVVFAHAFLPVSLVLGFCGVALLAALAVMLVADAGQEQFIWRSGSGEPVWSVPSVRLVMACCAAVLLTLAALIVTAAGARVLGRPEAAAAMPVTSLLGSAAAWLTPGIVTAGAALLIQLWWHNPARGRRPVLYVEGGPLLEANRGRVRSAVRARGWRPSWQVPGDSATNVAVALTAPEASEAREFDPRWPLRVSVEDLEEGEVFERLDRRREIQFRRHLCRGLERLFKIAAGQRFRNGTGYWLAPHLWFLAGLTRDEQEQTAEREDARLWMPPIGPPYFRLFHRDARHYLYRVLRALEIDLFFVEDGVTHRNLVRVVRALFEAYDRSGGRRRAEEILFQGLPRVRVMIHDFHIDQPFRSEVYPEPRFEDLGRARILHIFRDRGEHEEPVEPPGDFSRSPAPVLVG